MPIFVLLVALLGILLVSVLPVWSYNAGGSYVPGGVVALFLIIPIALLASGRL